MTTERKKALLMIGITFITGIVLGVLGTGFFARQHYNAEKWNKATHKLTSGIYREKIFKVVKADSNQRRAMKPIIDQTIFKIDQIQNQGNQEVHVLMDSMKVKLQRMLNAEQIEELQEFIDKHEKRRRMNRSERH